MTRRPRRSLLALLPVALAALAAAPAPASATWSVIALDARTGRVVIASATCVPQGRFAGFPAQGLMVIQALGVPGVGVAAAQAGVDVTRENQRLVYWQLRAGTPPERILEMLKEDPNIERRQFGILDMQGRWAGFSGSGNGQASLAVDGRVTGTDIHFSVQGNILASEAVVHDAVRAFQAAGGSLTDRVMAAMVAADAAGGDRRCTCETQPVSEAPCETRTSFVAYLLAADPEDEEGESFNDGRYALYLNVTDDTIRPYEDANPVLTLQRWYEALPPEKRADPAPRE